MTPSDDGGPSFPDIPEDLRPRWADLVRQAVDAGGDNVQATMAFLTQWLETHPEDALTRAIRAAAEAQLSDSLKQDIERLKWVNDVEQDLNEQAGREEPE
jgi:hypothetical protein